MANDVKATVKSVETAAKETAAKTASAAKETAAKTKTAAKATASKTKAAASKTAAAAKTTAAKTKTAAKTTAKKTVAKAAAKTNTVKSVITVQYQNQEVSTAKIEEKVKAQFVSEGHAASSISKVEIYVKPEDFSAYYVINDKFSGRVDLF